MKQNKPKSSALDTLEHLVTVARENERMANAIARRALKKTYEDMYGEPIKVMPFYRFFCPWVGRTAFYNFLEDRGGIALDRCLGLLVSNKELRQAVGLEPNTFTEEEIDFICLQRTDCGLKHSLWESLTTMPNSETISLPPQACLKTVKEPNYQK